MRRFRLDAVMPLANGSGDFRYSSQILRMLSACLRLDPPAEHVLVAGSLALIIQSRTHPPNERVKPEQHFDDTVNQSRQIVSATHVRHFVEQHRLELKWSQVRVNAVRQKDHGMEDADDAGFHNRRRGLHGHHADARMWERLAYSGPHLANSSHPANDDAQGADRPDRPESPDRHRHPIHGMGYRA